MGMRLRSIVLRTSLLTLATAVPLGCNSGGDSPKPAATATPTPTTLPRSEPVNPIKGKRTAKLGKSGKSGKKGAAKKPKFPSFREQVQAKLQSGTPGAGAP